MALQQLLPSTMAFKKAILLVDSKSAIQTVASNKQATTQIVKEAIRTIKLNRQGKTTAFQWIPSHVGIHRNETADLLAKKGTTLQNKQILLNFKTINRLIKQKHKKNFPRKPLPHPARHSGKTSNPHGKTTKINPENKQLQISGSTQVTTVSQHTSIASKSSAITTAQYANRRTQQWIKITSLCVQN